MLGNAYECCWDWYGETYYSETPSGGWVDPKGPASGTKRIGRGGSYYPDDMMTRCAYRSCFTFFQGGGGWFMVGFRFSR
jgi:formylglycine-generating enzyme required for sulfatase activity